MADIFLSHNTGDNIPGNQNEIAESIFNDALHQCWIQGKKDTYHIVRKAEDVVASIGYVCHVDAESNQETLEQILASFQESEIGNLKKGLVGQYILCVKKNDSIYLFADFIGGRNLFYSDDGKLISSSLSRIEYLLNTSDSDLDIYKVLEFLAMRSVFYPTWIGSSTEHKQIKWLLPYEYLVFNQDGHRFQVKSVVYEIDNKKDEDYHRLSDELLSLLGKIIDRKEFRNSPVAISLTGGRDSRLIAAAGAARFPNISYRIAVSPENRNSGKDMRVARKIAEIQGVPLTVYDFQPGQDEERFREITEGMSPSFNSVSTSVIDSSGSYSLGLGGVYGTELFLPIPWHSIDDYIQHKVASAKQVLITDDGFWKWFSESLHHQFQSIKEHYHLSHANEADYIRIFQLLDTARYSSFILSAFNREGYQLEPYGNYSMMALALKVAPGLWGNHRRLGGDALIQKAAMAKLDLRLAKVMTYSSFRPMLPLSLSSLPSYLFGYAIQVADWLNGKMPTKGSQQKRTDLPGAVYVSDGWERFFIERTVEKYALKVASSP